MNGPSDDDTDPADDPFADDPTAPHEPGGRSAVRGPAALLDPDLRSRIEDEIFYQQTLLAAVQPPVVPTTWGGIKLFIGCTAILAAAVLLGAPTTARHLGLLVAVTVLHELGHVLGMQLFGFRSPRMFVVPLFAWLTAARRDTVPAWQRGVTLLLGPLPGLALGLSLFVTQHPFAETWLFEFTFALVLVNGFNLLPVAPLDGGRLFEVLFLAQRPWPGTLFRLIIVGVLTAGVVTLPGSINGTALGVLAVLVVLATPVAHALASSRRTLRRLFGRLPEEARDLSDGQRRTLYDLARLQRPLEDDPVRLGAAVRQMHANASARPASVRASTLLMAAYIAGVVVTAIFLRTALPAAGP